MSNSQFDEANVSANSGFEPGTLAAATQVESTTNLSYSLDEKNQHRIMVCLLDLWESREQCSHPFFYWDVVISDTFAKTIANIFYLSIIIRLKCLVIWDEPEYDAIVMVPDYEAIKGSKFGCSCFRSRETKPSRDLFHLNEILLLNVDTMKALLQSENQLDQTTANFGGQANLSSVGVISITFDDWESWFIYFKDRDSKKGKTWRPVLPENLPDNS